MKNVFVWLVGSAVAVVVGYGLAHMLNSINI